MDPATDPATESVPGPASDPATPPVPASATGPGNAPVTEPERLLARLDLRRLLVSLALSTESLVLAAFSVLTTVLLVTTGQAAIAGVALSLVLGLGVTVSRRLTSYYGFELTETASVLHVRRGLTAVSTQTIVPARVQGLVVIEPWLWRPFGWARLEVSLAGYRNTDADRVQASSTLVPVAPRAEVLAVVQHLLGHRHIAGVPLGPPPVRARWRAPVSAWTTAIGQDGRLVVSRRGVFARRLDMVPLERVQSVRLAQGPLDRVLRLVRVEVNSPPGPVHVFARVRDLDEGRALVTSLVSSARTEA
jgi:putative membrane protein